MLPLTLMLAGGITCIAFGLQDYLSLSTLRDHRELLLGWREAHPVVAAMLILVIYTAVVAFSLPGAVWMTIVAGFLFGPLIGSVYAVVAATVGATIIFLTARYAFSGFLRGKAGSAIASMEAGFQRNAFSYMLFLRLAPLFPFWLVNLVPAFLGVSLPIFFLGTLLGIIPGSIVYAFVGSGIGAIIDAGSEPDLAIVLRPPVLLPLLGLAILSLLPVACRHRRYRIEKAAARQDSRR